MGCSSSHADAGAVQGTAVSGRGVDIDAAVLAATQMQAGGLSQKLSLGFKCEDLPNMDTFSKSDPFCVLYKLTNGQWNLQGKTEVIHDNLNPEFVVKIMADFHFEQKEEVKVEVYDSDDNSQQVKNLAAHDYIGTYEFTLHEVVTARDQIVTRNLVNEKRAPGKSGRIVISAEEQAATANNEVCIFNPVGQLNESSLCFFIIYRNLSIG